MPAVLVHGNPDTHLLWERVQEHLGDEHDVIAVDLPGFAEPRPDDFPATKEAYVEWLLGQLGLCRGPSTSSGTTGAGCW